MYVAISRVTNRSLINFCDTDYKLNEGFIYKITNKMTNKIYIGSTKTSIEQRFQEHLTAKDTSSLHKEIQELGYQKVLEICSKSSVGEILFFCTGKNEILEAVKVKLVGYDDAKFQDFLSKFRSYGIEDISEITKNFQDFYNIITKGIGRGEVMLIMGLKDSKSGGTATKDIELNGKTYEVKELSGGEFSLASDGYITNSPYIANLNLLKKYLNKNVVPLLNVSDAEANILYKTIDYYTENGPNNASRGFINNLEKSCEILNKSIKDATTEKINYISVGGNKIAVSDEDYKKIKAGSGPVTVSFGSQVDDAKVSLYKLDKNPWVNNPSQVKKDLQILWDNFLTKLDGMIFYNYSGNAGGIFMNTEEVNNNFVPFRIVQNALVAKEKSKIKKEITEDEEYETI
jgi:hypothetical protein